MRTIPARFATALFCFLMLLTAFSFAQIKPWNQIQAPPLPAFTPPEPVRVQLSNGMVIFLQADHELPLISASARIRGGSIYEPASRSEEHTSELQSRGHLVCRLLL